MTGWGKEKTHRAKRRPDGAPEGCVGCLVEKDFYGRFVRCALCAQAFGRAERFSFASLPSDESLGLDMLSHDVGLVCRVG